MALVAQAAMVVQAVVPVVSRGPIASFFLFVCSFRAIAATKRLFFFEIPRGELVSW